MNALLFVVLAAALPSFEDFRNADRARRESVQWQSGESARLMRVEPSLLLGVARKNPGDWELQWGAAELLNDWKQKQPQFEAALAASGTNIAVALRFACAAASEHQPELAMKWITFCQFRDKTNCVPWLAELWLLHGTSDVDRFEPGSAGSLFRDYTVGAARARIRTLETAGYSKYAARRIGFLPRLYAVQMAQELRRAKQAGYVETFLFQVAQAMQVNATFIVTELAGESLESAVWERRKDSPDKQARLEAIVERRLTLTNLLQDAEKRVDAAAEERMAQYFDDLLFRGEAAALQRLSLDLPSR